MGTFRWMRHDGPSGQEGLSRHVPGKETAPLPCQSHPRPDWRGEAAAWAMASCASMGVFVPYSYFEWVLAQAEEELLRLPGAQLVLVTVEDGFVVADALVAQHASDPAGYGAPFTVRAYPAHHWCTRPSVPRPLRRWARRGCLVDISLCDRAGMPIVRFYGPHGQVALELESTAPRVRARSGER